jgi:hypothetical protein
VDGEELAMSNGQRDDYDDDDDGFLTAKLCNPELHVGYHSEFKKNEKKQQLVKSKDQQR